MTTRTTIKIRDVRGSNRIAVSIDDQLLPSCNGTVEAVAEAAQDELGDLSDYEPGPVGKAIAHDDGTVTLDLDD